MSILISEKEREHYVKALAAIPPIDALLNRVLVIQICEKDEVVENIDIPGFQSGEEYVKRGSFVIPKSSKEKMKDDNETVKAVVKSLGPCTDKVHLEFSSSDINIGDLVFVFPSVFETKWTFDGIDYFSYSYRDLVAKAVK